MLSKSDLLPKLPPALHLPYKPNAHGGMIAELHEAAIVFNPSVRMTVEEKVDGASVGIHLIDGEVPLIRNKDNFLRKGYMR